MSADRIAAQLARIVQSPGFKRSKRMRHFLEYVVEKTLQEEPGALKEFNIALDVFGRDEGFDPLTNSLVRVEAGRLRRSLEQYYLTAGAGDPVVIDVPKGAYGAEFHPGGEQPQPATAVMPAAPREKPAIAVLAFKNLSDEAAQEYFSEGIAEDILIKLSRFREFHVIARNSSFSFKDKAVNIQTISTELGVDYILQGSVRKAEQRVRISAQLVEAETEHQVWAERYDRVLEDIFELQDEIADTIAVSINPAFAEAELNRSFKIPREHLGAWDLVLRARHAIGTSTPKETAKVRNFAERAVALAPASPEALAILAYCHVIEAWYGIGGDPSPSISKAIEIARRAVEGDENNPAALAILGYALFIGRRYEESLEMLQQALDQNINYARGQGFYGIAQGFCGAYLDGIAALDRAISLSPRDPVLGRWITGKSTSAFVAGKFEEGEKFGHQAINIEPKYVSAHRALAANLSELGRNEEAQTSVQAMLQLAPDMSVGRTHETLPIKNQQDLERFCSALARAGLPE